MFRVDPKTVTRWAKAGKLTSIRTLGGHRRYREAEVFALLGDVPEQPADPMRAHWRTLWGRTTPPAAISSRLGDIKTVGELTGCDAEDLRRLGLRPPQVDEVRLVLHRKGLALRGEIADNAA